MRSVLDLLADKHKDWVGIVVSFGCNKDTAEDLVQEMYIKMHRLINTGTNIMYNDDEINYFYVFRTLRTMFIDLTRKQKKINIISIDTEEFIEHYKTQLDIKTQVHLSDEEDLMFLYNEVNRVLDDLHWYDRKIYQYIEDGESVKSLSDKTKISYYSIYNTYRRVKTDLKKIITDSIKFEK